MNIRSIAVAFIISTFLVACGDKGSSGNGGGNTTTATTPLTAQYYYINKGICYDDQNRQVEVGNCEGLQGYYDVNGYCYNPSNVRVGNDYCQRYPSRVRPSCEGANWYYMNRGKRENMNCHQRACRGRNMSDRDGRIFYCRS